MPTQLVRETIITVRPAIPFRIEETLVARDAITGTELVDGLHVYVLEDRVLYKYNADDEAWSIAASPTAGHYRVVANEAARDAIAGDDLVVGMQVMVLNERRVYERAAASWKLAEVLPDFTLLDELTAFDSYAVRYFSAAGNDITGTGLIGAPYATMQRCVDSIPDGVQGSMEFRAVGAGPFELSVVMPTIKQGAGGLYVTFVGAGASVFNMAPLPAGTRDVNTQPGAVAGGVRSGYTRFTYGSAPPAITNGSHWIRTSYMFGEAEVVNGHTVNADDSSDNGICIIDPFIGSDLSLFNPTNIDLIPFTSEITGAAGYMSFYSPSIPVTLVGFFNNAGVSFFPTGNVHVQGCALSGQFYMNTQGFYVVHDVYTTGSTVILGPSGTSCNVCGHFKNQVVIQGVNAMFCAVVDTAVDPKMFVGFASNAGPHISTGCNFHAHFKGATISTIQALNASVRFFDDGSHSSCDGLATIFLQASFNSIVNMREDGQPSIFGTTTGPCVRLFTGAQSRGFGGHGGAPAIAAGALRNRTDAGLDIIIGGDPVTRAFAALPLTDVAAVTTQFVRAE